MNAAVIDSAAGGELDRLLNNPAALATQFQAVMAVVRKERAGGISPLAPAGPAKLSADKRQRVQEYLNRK